MQNILIMIRSSALGILSMYSSAYKVSSSNSASFSSRIFLYRSLADCFLQYTGSGIPVTLIGPIVKSFLLPLTVSATIGGCSRNLSSLLILSRKSFISSFISQYWTSISLSNGITSFLLLVCMYVLPEDIPLPSSAVPIQALLRTNVPSHPFLLVASLLIPLLYRSVTFLLYIPLSFYSSSTVNAFNINFCIFNVCKIIRVTATSTVSI